MRIRDFEEAHVHPPGVLKPFDFRCERTIRDGVRERGSGDDGPTESDAESVVNQIGTEDEKRVGKKPRGEIFIAKVVDPPCHDT